MIQYQKRRIEGDARLLIENVEQYIKDSIDDWAVSLELISAIEAQAFD